MLDPRIESFLAVYKNKSYTKASKELCITQPAVTQHIQFFEKRYGCRLLEYSNKELKLTKAGELLYKYFQNAKANEKIITQRLKEMNRESKTLKFAATLTIGEFTLSPILSDFIKAFSEYDITMYIDNTQAVLRMLQNGEIRFALVEGLFNKADYESRLWKTADFILTAPFKHPLITKKNISLEDLKNETIIVREKGSGSREVLERGLFDKNYTLENFKNIIEIGNVNVIKNMVKNGMGITFIYEDAVREEIKKQQLVEIKLSDFAINREFNFIHLRSDIIQNEVDMFYSFFKNNI
ncbi:DNA-binding transcriptional regulator, LysR family [Anaerovirgula multivorans]|uniref:DNA-binding transcriptional regulator, LysR family n=1 Tax=Anaerovirgula multivorans TaxID=312168 RepID=A0A239DEN6_9FIRM|nr:LysR family transcriptional regulator [Anaerovirgula multivorans]SNS30522.1 DNA-binding transcriptional regulator, LysR family [Anaerovirgula multivorans]